jgi:transposase
MSLKLTAPLAQAWKRRIDRWRQSGLSAAAFSKQEKVSQPRLYTWRKRFVDAGQAPESVPPPIPAAHPSPAFVPVKFKPAQATIELALKSGHVLRLPADFAPSHLADLLRALEAC